MQVQASKVKVHVHNNIMEIMITKRNVKSARFPTKRN